MNDTLSLNSRAFYTFSKYLGFLLLAICMLSLAGCGRTKVYTAQKTVTYNGALYNMGNVQVVSPRIEGKMPDGDVRNMSGMDKKAVEALLDEGSPIMVSMVVDMDSQEMVYRRNSVSKYSDYSKMKNSFDSAMGKINKFMANKKSTQLKLK